MKAKLFDLSIDFYTRRQKVTFEIEGDFRRQYDEFIGKDLELTVKPFREKRSLNANAYMWVLIGKLAEAMNRPVDEIYRHAIKAVGIYKDFPPLPISEAGTLQTAWRSLGEGWIAEQLDYDEDGESVIIRCWYGSSVYNTKQMSRLLDYIIEDCRALGIETLTPEELARIKAEWKGAKIC